MNDARQRQAGRPAAAPDATTDLRGSSGLCVRAAELSAVRVDAREVDFVCSTDVRDSYGEIVRQNWRLARFASNPVALWSHDAHALPIGQWLNVRVENGALRGTFKAATAAANPLAEQVWQSILEKTLRTVSVGFKPGKVSFEDIEGEGEGICCLDDNELFEISVTPLPANPEALVEMKARAKAAFLSQRRPRPATKTTPAPARAPSTTTERRMTTKSMVTCPHCGEDFDPDDDDGDEKTAKAKKTFLAFLQRRTAPIVAERDAAAAKATELATANAGLVQRLTLAELTPLSGVKFAPAQLQCHQDLAAFYATQGEAGAKKWTDHLATLKAGPDLKILGDSVIGKDPTGSGLQTGAGAGADGSELAALINSTAAAGAAAG